MSTEIERNDALTQMHTHTHTHTHTELQRNDTVTQIALCKIRQVHVC